MAKANKSKNRKCTCGKCEYCINKMVQEEQDEYNNRSRGLC